MLILESNKTKRDVIIEKATNLIREKGYVATTMRDLAAEVGMEAASLYNHIQSKEHILSEVCFALANYYTDQMEVIYKMEANAITKIRKLIQIHLKINAEHSSLAAVMNDEWRHLSEPDNSNFLAMRHDYEDKFIQIIDIGVKNGSVNEVDPKIALFTILSSVRWLQHWYHKNRHLDYDDLERTISSIILNGIESK